MTDIINTLTPEQVDAVRQDADRIANAATSGAIGGSQFVFFAAFDGTNNDLANIAMSGNPQRNKGARLEFCKYK